MTKAVEASAISSQNALQPIGQYTEILQPRNNESFVRSILVKALSDPRVYVGFAELRSIPTVLKALQESSTGRAMLDTLDLFSYGTYRQYASMPDGKFITLTASQLTKLKALTVVTIVQQRCDEEAVNSVLLSNLVPGSSRRSRRGRQSSGNPVNNSSCRIIPYTVLQSELDIFPEVEIGASGDGNNDQSKKKLNVRSLEDLLIHCIYSHLLPPGSKLDQRNMALVINLSSQSTSSAASNESNHVLCRDVNVKTDVTDMISKLEVFYEKGKERMVVLNECIEKLNQDAVNDGKKWRNIEKSIGETKESVVQNTEPEDAMRMLIEGDAVGAATGRSERKVKRSRGWLSKTGVSRI